MPRLEARRQRWQKRSGRGYAKRHEAGVTTVTGVAATAVCVSATRGGATHRSQPGLSPLLQRGTVGEGDAPTLHGHPVCILELLHGARHGLAARADHLRDRLMRERLVDRVASHLLGEVEQEARD